MNWGKSIILAFVLFTIFIAVLVTVCIRQDVNLVSAEYYQEELAYSAQMVRMQNAYELLVKPVVKVVDANLLEIEFASFPQMESGTLTLFRPSDSRFDKRFSLNPSNTSSAQFSITGLPSGMYRARMQWMMNGKEFFTEQVIYL